MSNQVGKKALVLGGSMAGLLAACALAETYSEVTVVDRDELGEVAEPRKGAPQGSHAHALLARGQQALEELFPGLTEQMLGQGIPITDVAEMHWYLGPKRFAPAKSGLVAATPSRPLLEAMVRARVRALPGVRFLERADIVGVVADARNERVVGATVAVEGVDQVIEADLVVDATGRGSRTPLWLTELGYQQPAEERIKIGLSYTTCTFRMPENPLTDDQSVIGLTTPQYPRGAYFGRSVADRYILSLVGVLGDRPEPGMDGFLAYAKSLPFDEIHDAIVGAETLRGPQTITFPASVRRRYENLRSFPKGYLVVGDAVCSFNPIYGQGMTVAALDALALRDLVRAGGEPDARAYFRTIAKIIDAPWQISAGGDLSWPEVEGPRPLPVRMGNRYMARLQTAALVDGEITARFMRVTGLVDPPSALMRPGTMLRVLRGARRADADPSAGLVEFPAPAERPEDGPEQRRSAA